ncbi:MAG: hypothetical protein JWR72_911, partial [Flavisolibacter sp.]|nr:hypothetical protein [Flavisolibacter sp.]
MTAKKSASKIFIYVLTLFQLSLISTIAHGQSGKQKVCEPVSVTFKYFQKKNMNFLAGLGTASTEKDKKMYRWHSISVGINYFPINYLEVGFKVKPTITKYANIGSLYLTEYISSLRYYPLFSPCRKAALFTGIVL